MLLENKSHTNAVSLGAILMTLPISMVILRSEARTLAS